MTTFKRLPGLPAYGQRAIGFPPQWGTLGREGLVVEFTAEGGKSWVGNFRPGLGGLDDVRLHPNEHDFLVTSSGALWQVNPQAVSAEEIAAAVTDEWQLDESVDLLFNDQGVAFLRLGPSGVVWHTLRISWDGFREIRFESEALIGEAWSPIEDDWLPFTVDLKTGQVDGGSYSGPEMHMA
jgi:hypothetical protein